MKDLTPEQTAAGLSEAQRIINQSAGFYFAGELFPFAPEFKSLALRAIAALEADKARLDHWTASRTTPDFDNIPHGPNSLRNVIDTWMERAAPRPQEPAFAAATRAVARNHPRSTRLDPKPEKQPVLDRRTRGQVTRVTNKLQTVEHAEFPSSSNPNRRYRTVIYQDGKVLCNCQGWTMKKGDKPRQCKHTKELIGDRPTRDDGEFIYLDQGSR